MNLDAFWMPFTANRDFKAYPRLLVSANGMHYRDQDGREILDGTAGLWCVNAGHNQPRIVRAIQECAAKVDFLPSFQMGHPLAFELAEKLIAYSGNESGQKFAHVFFTNSGSESVDSALKIALAYHHMRGEPQRTRLIGRERAYHGVGFGGISVGGIANNRKHFSLLPEVSHLPHTHNLEHNAWSRGQPAWGTHLADELEHIIFEHGADTIAAVIIEPVAGSTGVLVPPQGYLEKIRAICDRHGILLIFDEVITGFGRLTTRFACDRFGIQPDIMTVAKGLTNASVPMGAVLVKAAIHDAFMQGKHAPTSGIELFHGYTTTAHPLACAAALATLEVHEKLGLLENAKGLEQYWEDAVHSLRGLPHVIDLRNLGIIAGIELEPIPGQPGARAYQVLKDAFEKGLMIRVTGDIIALSPPLILEKEHIDRMFRTLTEILK